MIKHPFPWLSSHLMRKTNLLILFSNLSIITIKLTMIFLLTHKNQVIQYHPYSSFDVKIYFTCITCNSICPEKLLNRELFCFHYKGFIVHWNTVILCKCRLHTFNIYILCDKKGCFYYLFNFNNNFFLLSFLLCLLLLWENLKNSTMFWILDNTALFINVNLYEYCSIYTYNYIIMLLYSTLHKLQVSLRISLKDRCIHFKWFLDWKIKQNLTESILDNPNAIFRWYFGWSWKWERIQHIIFIVLCSMSASFTTQI